MFEGIPANWLREKGIPEEFERSRLAAMAEGFGIPFDKVITKFGERPFGEMTDKWRAFVAGIQDCDELWSFSSPPHTFKSKLGCSGFAIVRDGKVRDTLVMVRS
jgi:hypothetical protein